MRNFLLLLFCSIFLQLYAQEGIITGQVTNEAGEPLVGASVRIKNTAGATRTDNNGRFTLKPDVTNPTLVISYLGYLTKEVASGDRPTLAVVLSENPGDLDEVVVVAYGTQKRANLTAAVSMVVAKDVVKNSNNDVTNTLTGRAPGLRITQLSSQPGRFDSQIDIRGFSYTDPNDYGGNQQGGPLFIIDGVQRDQASFARLDPNEIESVSVLKDASAAIYGVKAANGVILVTTKQGRQGDIELNYTGRFGQQFITRYPELSNAYQYATLYNEQQINNMISNRQQLTPPEFNEQQLADFQNGTVPGTDFLGAILSNSTGQQQHNLTLNGGTEKLRFFVSAGYFGEGGLFTSNIEYGKKYNFRTNLDGEILKGLTFGINLGYNNVLSKRPNLDVVSIIRNAWRISPTESIYSNNDAGYFRQFFNAPEDNPLASITEDVSGYNNTNDKALTSTFQLNYVLPFIEGLSAKALFAYDNSYSFNRSFRKQFYQYQFDEGTQQQRPFLHNGPSQLNEYFAQGYTNNLQASLNYQHAFGNHNLTLLALYDEIYRQGNSHSAQTQYVVDAIDQLAAGDRSTDVVGSGFSQSSNRSYVGRVNYNYASRYLAEFGFRYDGSSYFPPNSRWGFFPYGNLAWRISEEPFIKNSLEFLDNLKIRLSYGKLGDDVVAANTFAYLTGYTYPSTRGGARGGSVFGPGFVRGVDFKNSANPDITWYTSTTANIGLDISLWNGKLTFEGDLFRRDRDGLLAFAISEVTGTYGVSLPQVNLNEDRTQGFEVVMGHRSKLGNVNFGASGNITYARTNYRYREETPAGNDWDYYRNRNAGRYNDIIWGYQIGGQFQSFEEIYQAPIHDGAGNRTLLPGDLRYVDVNGDNVIDGRDQTVIGRGGGKPAIYFGTNLELNWKNFDFAVLLQGATMYRISYQDQLSRPFYFDRANPITVFYDRWHRADINDPNSEWIPGRYPSTGQRQNYKDAPNTFNTFDASYLRIKSIDLGYTFDSRLLKRVRANSLRVFLNAYNLYTWTGKGLDFIDPEYSGNRYYSYNYPITLNLNFGVQLSF